MSGIKKESLSSIVDVAIRSADYLEKELARAVCLRDRSTGRDLKRANYMIVELQNAIGVEDRRRETDRAWAKAHLSLEEYLGEEFMLMRVIPYIIHLKQPEGCYYSVVTTAGRRHDSYGYLANLLSIVYLEGSIRHVTGSALDALIVERFADFGYGVSPCHAKDQFNRRLGRVIAKGRLRKVLRAEGSR